MARKKSLRRTFLYVVASIFFCASLYHHYLRDAISAFSSDQLHLNPTVISLATANSSFTPPNQNATLPPPNFQNVTVDSALPPPQFENLTVDSALPPETAAVIASPPPSQPPPISTTAVLLPDWEVLVIISPDTTPSNLDANNYSCLFETNEMTPANSAGVLPFPDRATFTCILPMRVRRRYPFKEPVLVKNSETPPARDSPPPPLIRLAFVVYDSLTTDYDVVLFVKGVNTRQGINRDPTEFRCVFGDDPINGVKTAVTTSMQEVFRCQRPAEATAAPLKVSLQIVTENVLVPSVAYYTPPRKLESRKQKSLLCAATMVYDVTKYLKEWVVYNSKIGVEKFLLYDNGSDDDLQKSVDQLVGEGFDITTYFWRWPKTQEAGFSHSVLYALDACTWMMYMDVDEFVYSPSWYNLSQPSTSLLHSLIPSHSSKLGQMSINCHEFGPSGQQIHPAMGVTQGYTCRRKFENRHKSIVLLKAVDDSLLNVIHHFQLKKEYKARTLSSSSMVVNHYKYQAWPEFKAKFRRRVSAYVLDWTNQLNPKSNDRTPGLGFSPIEPEGWSEKFCEVHDNRLKELVLQWFGNESDSGVQMPWQR